MLSFMRRWSAPFERYDGIATLLANSVTTPLLAVATAYDDDDDDDDDDENLQPICPPASEAIDDNEAEEDDDDDDDDVFETGWPDSSKMHRVYPFLAH